MATSLLNLCKEALRDVSELITAIVDILKILEVLLSLSKLFFLINHYYEASSEENELNSQANSTCNHIYSIFDHVFFYISVQKKANYDGGRNETNRVSNGTCNDHSPFA